MRKMDRKALVPEAEADLHPDDRTVVGRIVKDAHNCFGMTDAMSHFDRIVTRLGSVLEYRVALDPLIDSRAYLRLLILEALSVDAELDDSDISMPFTDDAKGYDFDTDIPF